MTRRPSRWIGVALLGLLSAGCRSEPPDSVPPPADPVEAAQALVEPVPPAEAPAARTFRIVPESPTLQPGDLAMQFRVEEDVAEGAPSDLTTEVTWSAEPTGVVAVEPGGYVRPIRPGSATVRAEQGGEPVAETRITVEGGSERPWDFAADIVPIFTRHGCNSGGCHGRADGQNGFHLSLFGYDSEGDHRSITRDSGGRRLDLVQPDHSLLIRKATGSVAHGGGQRFEPGTDDHRTLTSWIAVGAPQQEGTTHGPVVEVTVEPRELWLDGPGRRQLRVVARHADGHERDVTRLATYRTNDDSAAVVDEHGRAELLRRAETDLVVRYQSTVLAVRIGSPIHPDLSFDFAALKRRNVIDEELFARLEQLKVPPSPPADDASFLRRISLDLTGQLPRPDEIRAFLADADPEKRSGKVDELMGRRDFLLFWGIKLGDLLQITSNRFPGAGYYQMWLRQRLTENAPWDAMVVELLTATGKPNSRAGGAANYALDGPDPQTRAELTAQRFLGLRLRCAQCHDHPFDVWTQDDYYGLAAFFAKVQYGNPMTAGGMMMAADPQVTINPEGQVVHLRTGEVIAPILLDGTPVETATGEDPRKALAEWITDPANPYFSRAAANWVWAQFFGRGLAEPADDLSAANPPVHPELLDALARHFVERKYDLRDLIRTVATSEAYGLSSATVSENEFDRQLFSHHLARPLTAHQMADALVHATDVENRYPNRGPQTKAVEIFDPAVASTILDTFGRCPRTNGCSAASTPSLSLRQALLLIGGDVIDSKVASLDGYLDNSLEFGIKPADLVENLYLRTVCRYPTNEERSHWTNELEAAGSLREAAEDLLWALLNSREFAFNH